MSIGFDPVKRQATLDARGLDLARADEVFAGATLTAEDDRKDYGKIVSSRSDFWTGEWWFSSGRLETAPLASSA